MQKLFTTAALCLLTNAVELNDITLADTKTHTLPGTASNAMEEAIAVFDDFHKVVEDYRAKRRAASIRKKGVDLGRRQLR